MPRSTNLKTQQNATTAEKKDIMARKREESHIGEKTKDTNKLLALNTLKCDLENLFLKLFPLYIYPVIFV
jgi:hypothetical protein